MSLLTRMAISNRNKARRAEAHRLLEAKVKQTINRWQQQLEREIQQKKRNGSGRVQE